MIMIDTHKLYFRIIEILQRPMDIIFLDESGFDNFQALSKGYSLKGTGPIVIDQAVKSGNITLILAISYHFGVITY